MTISPDDDEPRTADTLSDAPLTRAPTARLLGVHVSTVVRMEKRGVLHPKIADDGTRIHDLAEVRELAGRRVRRGKPTASKTSEAASSYSRSPELDAQVFKLCRERRTKQEIVEIVRQPYEVVYALVNAWATGEPALTGPDDLKDQIVDELREEVTAEVRGLRADVKRLEAVVERAEERLEAAERMFWEARQRMGRE